MSDSDDVISGDSSVGDGGWQEQQQYLVKTELVMLPQETVQNTKYLLGMLPQDTVHYTKHLCGNIWKITVSIVLRQKLYDISQI
jgi:hypothetical protein